MTINHKNKKLLSIVVPCYNEEAVLPETVKRLGVKLNSMIDSGRADAKSRMLLVDDGSRDKTWELITAFSEENPLVSGIKLAHNRGWSNCFHRRAAFGCDQLHSDKKRDLRRHRRFEARQHASWAASPRSVSALLGAAAPPSLGFQPRVERPVAQRQKRSSLWHSSACA